MSSGTASETDSQLPAADGGTKRQSENSEDEPPRKRQQMTGGSHQAETDEYGWTELHRAAFEGDVEKIRELLALGFDTCARDKEGGTALHLAIRSRKEAAALLLVDADSCNIRDRSNLTPLHVAAMIGCARVLRALVAAGGNMRLQNVGSRTPLHHAVSWGCRAAAEFLADVDGTNDVRDAVGMTPLRITAAFGYTSIVKKLLFSGVCPYSRGAGGEYVLRNSLREGSEDISKVILAMCAWRGIDINWNKMRVPTDKVQWCNEVLSECYAEIKRMKNTKLDGMNVSYHELGMKHVSKISPRLANEVKRQVLRCDRATADFPYYVELMAFKVKQAEERRVLADRFLECFSVLARKWPPLPRTCTDIVLLCLSEQDMRNFICATKLRARTPVKVINSMKSV
ncbi:ankyrin repeat and protein kinase domain-containing protein 1-like [Uloborus diversus]|uniref:ankyrin repeat and protein kinase domain-containing protein 1-like n=1 Tax=Uloborus diversus TaxID=327109 RepID=UPI00240A98C2|nr:ankyrin repeat and protein kinase domain-containing protein 1-like [Uloborus diversus]